DQVVPLEGGELALRLDALTGLLRQLHLEAGRHALAVEVVERRIGGLGRHRDLEGGRREFRRGLGRRGRGLGRWRGGFRRRLGWSLLLLWLVGGPGRPGPTPQPQ